MKLLDKNIKIFTFRVFCFFLPLFLLALFLLGLGVYSGELWPLSYVIDYVHSHPRSTLFLKGYIPEDRLLKYYETLKRNPDILMIGSSRTLTFREEMFGGADFYNAGRLVQNYQDLVYFLENVFPKIQPKTIYFNVDWYLLGDKTYIKESEMASDINDEKVYDWRAEMYFFRRFLRDLIKNPYLISRIINHQPDMVSGKTPIGVQAFYGDGVRFDGSMQFGAILMRRRDNPAYVDAVTPSVLDQIKSGASHFKFDNHIDQGRVETIKKFLKKAQERNIKVIGFSSPYSTEAYQELAQSASHKEFFSASRKKLREIFQESEMFYFDFHDLSSLGLDDRYMLDGAHMGDTASAIVVKAMTKDSILRSHLDKKINQKNTTPLEISW